MAEASTSKPPAAKKKAAKKKTAKKKAVRKTTPKKKADDGIGILQQIREELSAEYEAKLAEIKETASKAVSDANSESEALKEIVSGLEKTVSDLQEKLKVSHKSQKEQEEIAAKLRDLSIREEALTKKAAEMESERDSKINDIVNTRTARMKEKLDEELKERLTAASSALLVGQDAQIKELYHRLGMALRESRCPPIVMTQTLALLSQSVLREQRARFGVDAPPPPPTPPAPTPPTPPQDSDEETPSEETPS